jgi:hypothetical protein
MRDRDEALDAVQKALAAVVAVREAEEQPKPLRGE